MSYGNCPKKNKTIASFTTNTNNPETASWDLTPFQTVGMGPPGGTWRLIEVGYPLLYGQGKIAADGTLAPDWYEEPTPGTTRAATESTPCGLQNSVNGTSYDGYLELQVTPPEEEKCPNEECEC